MPTSRPAFGLSAVPSPNSRPLVLAVTAALTAGGFAGSCRCAAGATADATAAGRGEDAETGCGDWIARWRDGFGAGELARVAEAALRASGRCRAGATRSCGRDCDDDPDEDGGPAAPSDPVVSAEAVGIHANTEPTPRAAASRPTLPTHRAEAEVGGITRRPLGERLTPMGALRPNLASMRRRCGRKKR